MIILGIDPGLADTGWGVVACEGNHFRCLAYGCVSTAPSEAVAGRLKSVHDEIAGLIGRHSPDECAIESLYFNVNVRTAFATGQARGAALLATADAGIPVEEYGPGEVKLAVVGNGNADKKQVQYMVRAILGLAEEPRPEHAADALALAICHAHNRVARAREREARASARAAEAHTRDTARTKSVARSTASRSAASRSTGGAR